MWCLGERDESRVTLYFCPEPPERWSCLPLREGRQVKQILRGESKSCFGCAKLKLLDIQMEMSKRYLETEVVILERGQGWGFKAGHNSCTAVI